MKHLPSIAALLVACVALLVAWNDHGSQPQPKPAEPPDLSPLIARIDALERERHHERTPTRLEPAPPPREEANAARDEAGRAELEARMARLEQRIATSAVEGTKVAPAEVLAGKQTSDELRALVRDARRSEEERLRALGDLRGRFEPDGTDARLAVLDEMILLARTSVDAKTRADVWRQLSRVTDERLKQPLLDALAFDADAKAREEAAETLAGFRTDPVVDAALRAAAQNDASANVRRQANGSLAGGR